MLKTEGVTHWSIPVDELEESERSYRELRGILFSEARVYENETPSRRPCRYS